MKKVSKNQKANNVKNNDLKTDDLKDKALRYSLITVIILVFLIILISYIRKQSSTILKNDFSDPLNIQEKIVFDDIKIKMNNDIFSYDQIRNEVKEKKR